PELERGPAEDVAQGFERLDAVARLPETEKRVELVAFEAPDSGAFQLQQMRLARIDIQGVNTPRVFEEQRECIAASRTNGEHGVAGLDSKGHTVSLGILPAH